jgi:hypothetical protein
MNALTCTLQGIPLIGQRALLEHLSNISSIRCYGVDGSVALSKLVDKAETDEEMRKQKPRT